MTPPEVSSPKLVGVVADEVAQPADDLLLDERRERTGVPDVDALLGDLGEQLADDRHRERRRGEVAQRARVIGVELVRRDAGPELVEERRRRASGRAGLRPGSPVGPKNASRSSA